MSVYGIVGLPGSGKTEAATVAREMDIPVVTMGDVIRDECRERGLDPATEHGTVAKALREENGPGAVAQRSIPRIEQALEQNDTVLIDGIRSDVEVSEFEAAFGEEFTLLCIDAPYETRARRLELRGRDASDEEGGEPLKQRDRREREFGMGKAMEMADLTIENDGSLDAFHERIRTILAGLEIEITAPVYETELPDRIEHAITNLFPDANPKVEHGEMTATATQMEAFSELLHRQEILDTARGVFFENRRGESFSFQVKKQPAHQGVVNFAVEDPGELGAISVRVRTSDQDVETIIDQIAPPTEGGQPVDPGRS